MASLRHCLEGSLKGTSGRISYVFLLCFTVLLKQLRRLYTSGSIFKCRQCIITAPSVPTTCYKALTNQGGTYQYIDHVVYFNRIDSHHHPNEHTILYVFRAPGYDSLCIIKLIQTLAV